MSKEQTSVLSCLILYKDFYLTFIYYFKIYKLVFALRQFIVYFVILECQLCVCVCVRARVRAVALVRIPR